MKILQMFSLAFALCSTAQCNISKKLLQNVPENRNLMLSVKTVINHLNVSKTFNLVTPGSSARLADFNTLLLMNITEETRKTYRVLRTSRKSFVPIQRQHAIILIVEDFQEFLKEVTQISSTFVMFNGIYVVVLINGKIPEIKSIFEYMWRIQIHNVVVLFEESGSTKVQTFLPFNPTNCSDTTPVQVNSIRNGKFLGNGDIFPRKMGNLFGCTIRVSTSDTSEPLVKVRRSPDGTYKLGGAEVTLVNTLSKKLNFTTNFTFVGSEGFFLINGTSEGPLRVLLDGGADISIANWWLKLNRLKFLGSTTPYASDRVVLMVPLGEKFSALEKIFYPFKSLVWLPVILIFLIGFSVILVLRKKPLKIQRFVFGSRVKSPAFNLFIAFIGGTQNILPQRNFARFLLMSFLMYSLVMRTLYQASFFQLLQSNMRHKEVQSLEELIEKDFKIYCNEGNLDVLLGLDGIRQM